MENSFNRFCNNLLKLSLVSLVFSVQAFAQNAPVSPMPSDLLPGKKAPVVTDIWVVFKTHFDLGFTDLPENVFKRYREEMMDNALTVIEKNRMLPKEKRFAWTVSGWP